MATDVRLTVRDTVAVAVAVAVASALFVDDAAVSDAVVVMVV